MSLDAIDYIHSLGLEVTEASQAAIGRLALAGEFVLEGQRGVLLRPKRGEVSDRYLELLAGEGYAFVVVDGGGYPAFYARQNDGFVPVRALPVTRHDRFPSREVLDAWVNLIRAAAARGEPVGVGVAQLVARLDDNPAFGPALVRANGDEPIGNLGGDRATALEPLRTAAALLAGYRVKPSAADELVRLLGAVSSLVSDRGESSGLVESLSALVRPQGLGPRRLLASGGIGAEAAVLFEAEGTMVLPTNVIALEPLLERLLPRTDRVYADFLQSSFDVPFDGAVVVPPVGVQVNGARLDSFELAKRGGKARRRVPAELLFVEKALSAMAPGALLVTVLPEGLLSSAGHADFRAWLLEHARLLAVVSLPAGTCFRGTGVKCSVVVLSKTVLADDYPILMLDVEGEGDLDTELEAAQATLQDFLEREVAACA